MTIQQRFQDAGFIVLNSIIPVAALRSAREEILKIGNLILDGEFIDLDEMYTWAKINQPEAASLLYDACKSMIGITSIAQHPALIEAIRSVGCLSPASIDVNFRIDSKLKEKYLFEWHQDYWFSIGSKNGIVAWIPLTDVTIETGGLELIPGDVTGRKIFKVTAGTTFNSYADAVKLDESIPLGKAFPIRVSAGDALLFRFDILHKSLPILSDTASRWTLQARFADFEDEEFRKRKFRPASVSKDAVPYLDELNQPGI